MKKGFTLVELLVVIAILSILGVMILTIFTRSLRGNNKSQVIATIKQNGQSVLENIDKTIRNSDNVVCISIDLNTLVIVKDGTYTRYRFVPSSPSINGLIQQDTPIKQLDRLTSKEETDPVFVNRVCATADPMIQPVVLTDTSLQSGVS